jgi:predicted nucleic acid-binding protein
VSAVVSDTSPLQYLIQCDAVNVLPAIFGEVVIPATVHLEIQHSRTPAEVRSWANHLPLWATVREASLLKELPEIDEGEREAISLALEINAPFLLIDDRRGRIEAIRLGLHVAGTIGILEIAARRDLLKFSDAVEKLRKTGARIGEDLIEAAWVRVYGEMPPLT